MNTRPAGVTDAMADFAVGHRPYPALARQRALDAMIDCLACMYAGSREPLAAPLLKVLPTADGESQRYPALFIGTGRYGSAADAALYNGAVAHALDYDDTNHPAYAHPSAVLLPALLAAARMAGASGSELIDGYIAGFEIFGKLGRAMNTQHYKRGWHATSSFGTLAATVAIARILKLSHRQTVMALGIAASSASGLRANFGSMVKPLHAGYAARNAVLAALLAREDFDAAPQALEHPYGYLSVFNAGIGFDTAPLMALGEDLEILTEHGLALKPYPACGATHPGIEAALSLHPQLAGEGIAQVQAGVCEMAFSPLIYVMPHTPLEGKFSLHYCIAAALVFGEVNLSTFTDAKVADPRVRSLIPKISMKTDERWRDDSEFATEVIVTTETGRRLARHIALAAGKPDRWFSPEQLRAKFDDCTHAFGSAFQHRVFTALRGLDSADDVLPLIEQLRLQEPASQRAA
ncbi:MAG: MmgE/PrpD family protein [Betaproteobacteria bacterium]